MQLTEQELESKQFNFKVFGINIWASHHSKKQGWLRIFGKGIKWKHKSVGLIFSERNGYTKYFKIGNYIFGYLC